MGSRTHLSNIKERKWASEYMGLFNVKRHVSWIVLSQICWGFSPQSLYSVSLSSWIFQFGQEKFHLGSAHLGGFFAGMLCAMLICEFSVMILDKLILDIFK